MNPDQIPELLRTISYADPRILSEDPAERRGKVAMWAGILADVPYDFALTAAQQHYSRSPYPILPTDIATRWHATVRDRLNRHVEHAPPGIDPDQPAIYRQAVHAERRAVAEGTQLPAAVRQLTAGIGRPVEPAPLREEHRTQLVAAIPGYGASRAAHPELTVECPWCRAQPNNACTRGRDRHRLADTHPYRKDLYAAHQTGAAS